MILMVLAIIFVLTSAIIFMLSLCKVSADADERMEEMYKKLKDGKKNP